MGRGPAELALAERSGYVESRHLGAAAVCTPEGRLLASLGDPTLPVYLRSTAKPLQALAVAALGAGGVDAGAAPGVAGPGGLGWWGGCPGRGCRRGARDRWAGCR